MKPVIWRMAGVWFCTQPTPGCAYFPGVNGACGATPAAAYASYVKRYG